MREVTSSNDNNNRSSGGMGCGGSVTAYPDDPTLGPRAGPGHQHPPSASRPCRVVVHILAAKELRKRQGGAEVRDPVLKVRLDGAVRKYRAAWWSGESAGGVVEVNQSFSFEVKDPHRAVLTVQVQSKARGALLGGKESLGRTRSIAVRELLMPMPGAGEAVAGTGTGPRWYGLVSKDGGRAMPGQVQVQVVPEEAEAQAERRVSALVATWNVGNARPAEDLSPWLPLAPQHEIVAVGSQECDYPTTAPAPSPSPRGGGAAQPWPPPHAQQEQQQPQQQVQASGSTGCGSDWVDRLSAHLARGGQHHRYTLVQAVSRGQMRLAVFVRQDVHRAVSEVHTCSEATGVGHVVANKGGVCICFKLWDTSLCFVNSHFAAHAGQCDARNSNFREITGQMRVGPVPGLDILNQFHHLFWLGDLNYRLAPAPAPAASGGGGTAGSHRDNDDDDAAEWRRVVGKVQAGELQELLARDELRRERAAARAFYGFKEGDICFPPTFKVRRGVTSHTAYDRKRVPAWCDRILWKDLPGCPPVELLSYTSAPEVCTSDHKPVAATFSFTARSLPGCDSCSSNNGGAASGSGSGSSIGTGTGTGSTNSSSSSTSGTSTMEDRWNIRFRSLRARHLRSGDMNGLSDPYVSFVGPLLLDEVRSKVKPQTLNPVWEPAADVPPLVLAVLPLERLRLEHLPVRLMDRDYASSDDHLAYGVIPLAGLVDAFRRGPPDEVADFRVDLTFRGLPAGTLEGSMRLTYEKSCTKKKCRMKADLVGRTLLIRDSIVKRVVSRRHVHL